MGRHPENPEFEKTIQPKEPAKPESEHGGFRVGQVVDVTTSNAELKGWIITRFKQHQEMGELAVITDKEGKRDPLGFEISRLRPSSLQTQGVELKKERKLEGRMVQKPGNPEELYVLLRSLGTIKGSGGKDYPAEGLIKTIHDVSVGLKELTAITKGTSDPRVVYNIRELVEHFMKSGLL